MVHHMRFETGVGRVLMLVIVGVGLLLWELFAG